MVTFEQIEWGLKKNGQIQEILRKNNSQGFFDRFYVWRGAEKGGTWSDSHMSSLSNNWTVVTSADREYRKKTHLGIERGK